MNKLDIISQIWNYFQGCANSVHRKGMTRLLSRTVCL